MSSELSETTAEQSVSPSTSWHRESGRSALVSFRMSPERKAHLRREAAKQGISMQTYLDRIVWGEEHATDRTGGRQPKKKRQEELPLTG